MNRRPAPLRKGCRILFLSFSRVANGVSGLRAGFGSCLDVGLSTFIHRCSRCCRTRVRRVLTRRSFRRGVRLVFGTTGTRRCRLCLVVSRCSGFAGIVLGRHNRGMCRTVARTSKFCHSIFGGFGNGFRHVFVVNIDPMALSSIADKFGVN